MARLFKRKGDPRWRVGYLTASGRWSEKVGTRSKRETERYMLEVLKEVDGEKQRQGDPVAEHAVRPIQEHVEDYLAHLEAGGRTEYYRKGARRRLEEMTRLCRFKKIGDLDPDRIMRVLSDLQADRTRGSGKKGTRRGLGAAELSARIRGLKSLELFLLNRGRVAVRRLGVLKPFPNTEPRHPRRALTPEEQAKLIETTRKSTRRMVDYTGEQRALLYALALCTGLRAGELAQLKRSDFHKSDTDGTFYVKVRAAVSKNRRMAFLPIRADVVPALRARLEQMDAADQKAFPGTWPKNAARMVRRDLQDAGIEYENDQGIADFHALRVSCVTTLALHGVPLQIAQQIARHSDPKLTANIYSKFSALDLAKEIEKTRPVETPQQRSDKNEAV